MLKNPLEEIPTKPTITKEEYGQDRKVTNEKGVLKKQIFKDKIK